MSHYKVTLEFIDAFDGSRNIEFATTVEALNRDDAIAEAKAIQQSENLKNCSEKPWSWSAYETSEH